MLYFLGNCQMDFLGRAITEQGFDCSYRVLASPFTYSSSPGIIPADLNEKVEAMELGNYFHDRSVKNQFQMIGPDEEKPELIVMNLFHENSPLFIHNESKYIFFMDPAAWASNPELEAWMQNQCGMIQPNPATYLKRYGEMLANVRRIHSKVPIIVTSRLSHFPAFGPDPFSYLQGWAELGREAPAHFELWTKELDNVHVIDMDRVFGGIWDASDKHIETHCPFLKIKLEEKDGVVTGLHASRDVEHVGSMWPRLAEKITEFMQSGSIGYNENEKPAPEWTRPWKPLQLSKTAMLEKLASGGNYLCAQAVGSFFLDFNTDYTDLLAQTGKLTPVCHNTLHMIKGYARIWKNPVLAKWCDAHTVTAKQFTANGPLYQADYLHRIDEIKHMVLNG
ncbi:MAG: SGNH/GDSL hydrolase family protein [Pseudodesulfovibrio sp.]|nr:SGNH/GDSL hydrolase family protein [Pseudodesulfovibrio sp.]